MVPNWQLLVKKKIINKNAKIFKIAVPVIIIGMIGGSFLVFPELQNIFKSNPQGPTGDETTTSTTTTSTTTTSTTTTTTDPITPPMNHAPVLSNPLPITDPSISPDSRITFGITASDPENDPLTYIWTLDEIILSSQLDTLILDPAPSVEGVYNVSISVSDSEFTSSYSWQLTIVEGNHAPILSNPLPEETDYHMNDTNSVILSIDAYDPDGDFLTYTWYFWIGIPDGGNQSSLLVQTSANDQWSCEFWVEVTDGVLTTTFTWMITVHNIDYPMTCEFTPEVDPIISEGEGLWLSASPHDIDGISEISYLWKVDDEILFTENSSNYYFEANINSKDSYEVFVNVSSPTEWITHTWVVFVEDTNVPPQIVDTFPNPNSYYFINEMQTANYSIEAIDPNLEDNLTYTWTVDGIPQGENKNFFNFTTDYDTVSLSYKTFDIMVNVSDGDFHVVEEWILFVFNINPPPTIGSIYPDHDPQICEGSSQYFNISVYHPASYPITYEWSIDGMVIGGNSSEILYNASLFSTGIRNITVVGDDGYHSVSHSWSMTIENEIVYFDLNPTGDSDPNNFHMVGDLLLFTADDGTHGRELWVSDGTEPGTFMIEDINVGSEDFYGNYFVVLNDILYFACYSPIYGREIWRSDGTPTGTYPIDLISGSGSSYPLYLTAMGNYIYFSAEGNPGNAELWRTGGTLASTILIEDIRSGEFYGSNPESLHVVGSTLYFEATTSFDGRGLCKTDGNGIDYLCEVDIDKNWGIRTLGDKVIFTKFSTGKLWVSDGTIAGTHSLENVSHGNIFSYVYNVATIGDYFYFTAENDTTGREMWRTDGTIQGTELIVDLNPGISSSCFYNTLYPYDSIIFQVAVLNGVIYFEANDSTGYSLYRTDGTAAGTYSLMPTFGGDLGDIDYITAAGDLIYFNCLASPYGEELWKTDGTIVGTELVIEINLGGNAYPEILTSFGDLIYFSVWNGTNWGIWCSDGINEGTYAVIEVCDVNAYWWVPHFPKSPNALFISGDDGVHGQELWII